MSRLILVRHGQARIDHEDYDQLSTRGEAQARALGTLWRQRGVVIDHVVVGPRLRHRQTLAGVRETYGGELPEATESPAFDEHCGLDLFARVAPDVVTSKAADEEARRRHLQVFRDTMMRWVRGELETPDGLESWTRFRTRVAEGLDSLRASVAGGATVAVFTSGGSTAAAVGATLGLDEVGVLELSWWLRNASTSELLFSGDRLGLFTLNETGHIQDADLITHV